MSEYVHTIRTDVIGAEKLQTVVGGTDKLTGSTSRLNEVLYGGAKATEAFNLAQLKYYTTGQQLEIQREKHRMQQESLNAAMLRGAGSMDSFGASTGRASGGVRQMSMELGILEGKMPLRAAASFLSTIQGLGPAMAMAFPIFGAVALIGYLDKIPDAIHNGILSLEGFGKQSAETFKKSVEDADTYYLHMMGIATKVRNLNLIRPKGSARDLTEVSDAKAELADVRARLGALRREELSDVQITVPGSTGGGILSGMIASRFGATPARGLPQQNANAADIEKAKIRREARYKLIAELQNQEDELSQVAVPRATAQADANAIEKAQRELESEQKALDAEKRRRMDRSVGNNPIARAIIEARYRVVEHPTLGGDFALSGTDDIAIAAQAEQKKWASGVIKGIEAEPGEQSRFFKFQLEQKIKEEEEAIRGMKGAVNTWDSAELGRVNTQAATIRDTAGRRSRLLAAGADKDEELTTLRQQITLRKEAAADELKLKEAHSDILDIEKARLEYTKEIGDIDLDYAIKILEIKKAQKNLFESEVVGLLNAGRSGGSSGLRNWGMGQLNRLEDTAVSHLAGIAWGDPSKGTGISGQLSKVIPKGGPLDKIFGLGVGTGPDALKTAGTGLQKAAADLSLAAGDLRAAARSPSGGGGSAGGGRGFGGFSAAANNGIEGGIDPFSAAANNGIEGGIDPLSAAANNGIEGRMPGDITGGGPDGSGMTLGKGVGMAGAAMAAGYGAYSGFKKGGARGAMSGTASILGGAAAIAMMIPGGQLAGAILGGVSLGLGVATSLLGDPVANRQTHIAHALQHNQYMAPVAVNASMSTGGTYSDMDRFGNVRDSNFSPFPTVQQGFFDYRNNVTVPGRTNSQFGGPSGSSTPVVVNISAVDAKSILDRHQDIGDAVARSLQRGSSPALSETLSSRNA